MKKIWESRAGKRAVKIIQASEDPVEAVTRGVEQAVNEGLVDAATVDVPTLFSSQKTATQAQARETNAGRYP